MTAHRELEIKLKLPPASVGRVKKIPLIQALKTLPKRTTEVSIYFDTNKHKLRKNGLMLRVRRIGKRYLQTIKASGDARLFERGEWENEIADREPDLSLVRETPLKPMINGKLRRQLKPMFETRVHRTVYPIAKRGHLTQASTSQSQPRLRRWAADRTGGRKPRCRYGGGDRGVCKVRRDQVLLVMTTSQR
jgi:inorganic triphosphatase YgiF